MKLTKVFLILFLVCLLTAGCTYYLYKKDVKNKIFTPTERDLEAELIVSPREGERVTADDMENYIRFEVEHSCGSDYSYYELLENYELSGKRIEEITSSRLYTLDIKKRIYWAVNASCPGKNN